MRLEKVYDEWILEGGEQGFLVDYARYAFLGDYAEIMMIFTVPLTFPWVRGICSCLLVLPSKPSQSLLFRPPPSSRSNASDWLLFPPFGLISSRCWLWAIALWWSLVGRSWIFVWSGGDWGWHWWSRRRRSWVLRNSCVWWRRIGCAAGNIGFHR